MEPLIVGGACHLVTLLNRHKRESRCTFDGETFPLPVPWVATIVFFLSLAFLSDKVIIA